MIRQRIQHLVASLLIVVSGGLVLVPAVASADLQGDACQGVNQLSGSNSKSCAASGPSVPGIMTTIINILSIIIGFAAVVMIIIGGLRFVTAGGDSNAIASARSTIIYAVVGLIVVAIAQLLVHFVLNKVKTS